MTQTSVKVGMIAEETGALSFMGRANANVARMVVDEINANGGLLGRKVELYLEDGATTDAVAEAKAAKLVAQDKVDVILGGIYSSTRQAIKGPAVVKGRTLYIYPEQYEGQECDPLIFCTGPVPAQQLDPLIPWLMRKTGAKTFYLPSADYIWPHVMNDRVRQFVTAEGGSIVGEEYYPLDHIDSGQHVGPRLFASGYFLTTTGGHFLTSGHALEVDGPYGWVKAIREQIKNGVDHIKLNLSGGIMGPAWDLHTHSFLLDDEIRAAFEICRKRGFKVMAHATNPEAVKNAIRLGSHSVEHGYIMDDECIALLLEHQTWYVPTLAISHLTASQATNPFEADWVAERGLSPALCCRAEAASDVHATWFRKALDAGVRMALGSDIRPLKDAALLEMGLWVRDGATPWQTLVAATRHGAAVCGVGADLGTVEVGKLADLIVIAANPLDDITNVRRLQLVLKEGRVVSDKRI